MTNLKDINFGLNRWCGPSVLSALTGKTTDECARVIGAVNGQTQISYTKVGDLLKALQRLRFDNQQVEPTTSFLYGCLVGLIVRGDGCYVVTVPGHVVAVEVKGNQIFLIDNHTKSLLPAGSSSRLLQRVDQIYRVTYRGDAKFLRTEYRLDKGTKGVIISAVDIHEHEADNIERRIGSFSYRDEEELQNIIKLLTHGGNYAKNTKQV